VIDNLFQIGEPVEHRGIVVAPLFPRQDPVASYLTFDEALASGLRIRETSESGSVPELVVENPVDARVLLYDGEELVGAKQNRILNVSVLVEAKSTLKIPVSCVEQGRWRHLTPAFEGGGNISHAQLRLRKAESLAAEPLARGIAQAEVWDEVREKAARMHVASPTGASADLCRAYEKDLRSLENAFPAQPGACGSILGIGPQQLAMDLVSRPDAFARLWPKLRAGYLLDALEKLDGEPTPSSFVEIFFSEAGRAQWSRQPSVGLGDDVRLRGPNLVGSGLELEGPGKPRPYARELIQLSAFRSGDEGRRAFGRIARPSTRGQAA